MDCSLLGSSVHGHSPGKNTGMGCHALLQGIFPTQGSSPGLLHCGWILYHLSHQGSPRILEWVAYPFSRGSSQPGDQTRVSCIAGGFFTTGTRLQFSSVQLLSCVRLFATPWTAARQASLSITNFRSLLKLMSIESVMPSNHLILCRPLLLPLFNLPQHQGLFSRSQFFPSGGQRIGVSASVSVLPMNI